MTIGSRIKKLRRERDMTQEDLAEFLGITAASVSQWECDKTAPDISQLPILAGIFEVTTDSLLGVDIENKEKEIDSIVNEAYSYISTAHEEKAIPILEEAIRRYPTSHRIMLQIIRAYRASISRGNADEQTAAKNRNEIIRLAEKILNECTDDTIRNTAKQNLMYTYQDLGMYEKIRELGRSQSPLFTCQEHYMVLASRGTQKLRYKQLFLYRELDDFLQNLRGLNTILDDGTAAYTTEEEIKLRKKANAILDVFFDGESYGFFHSRAEANNTIIAKLYAKLGDVENTLLHLEEAAKHAIISDSRDPQAPYTDLAFRDGQFSGVFHTSVYNLSHNLLVTLEADIFDFIRDDPRFAAIIDSLTPHAAER